MQDQSLTGPEFNVPPRGRGPAVSGGRVVRPVLRTVYSQPQKFIETPAGPRIGPRPTAFQASGGYAGSSKYGGAMANLIQRIMRQQGLL